MAEFNVLEFLSSLQNVLLVTERISENDVASAVYKVSGGFIALV